MPGSPRGGRRKTALRARVRFNRYGFDRVSLKRIPAGADQMDSGFYGYFESKNERTSRCPSLRVLVHRSGIEELPGGRGSKICDPGVEAGFGKTSA
jgi:hypothetical protein